jgi:undecaprenyl-diphosphatase
MKNRTRRNGWAILMASAILAPTSYWVYTLEEGNFHVVSEGQVYRSRQLTTDEMADYVQRYKIKSVLNLRGANKEARWYQEELRASELLGVEHYDYGISANHEVEHQDIEGILRIIRQAPKPILVHCKFGSDRTGLIAAAYLYAIERKAIREAEEQLSLRYGHFPYFWSRTSAMDRSFRRYVETDPPALERHYRNNSQGGLIAR